MAEELSRIISKGIETYSNNLNLCIPYILNIILNALAFLIMAAFGMVYLFSSFSFKEYNNNPEALAIAMFSYLGQHIYEIGAFVLIAILIVLFISSFFTSGAIGMAGQATETGKTELSTMMEAGKKNVFNLFLAEILFLLIAFAGIIFIVPGIKNINFEKPETSLLFLGGLLLWMIYLVIISAVLAVFRYAIVIGSLGPVEGMLEGIDFFKKNTLEVILLLLFIVAIVIVFSIVDRIIGLIPIINIIWFFVSFLISLCILNPLITLWWVRLYMTRTGKQVYVNELLAHPNDLPQSGSGKGS